MRFHQESRESAYDAIVVGSGLGGLTAAALLARLGRSVLVVERHDRIGGYAHAFRRGPYRFDSAVHMVGGCGPDAPGGGGLIHRLLEGLDVARHCSFLPVEPLYEASLPGFQLVAPTGVEAFIDAHARAFPRERDGIRRLVETCVRIRQESLRSSAPGDAGDGRGLSGSTPTLLRHRRATLAEVMPEFISDPRLTATFAAAWPYLGLPPSRASFVYWAIMLMSYVEDGAFYCGGTFQNLANALAKSVTAQGGEVLLRSSVRRIHTSDGRATGVTLENGQRIEAPVVVSNADLGQTVEELVGPNGFSRRFLSRLHRLERSYSAVVAYAATDLDLAGLGLEHETFLYSDWDHERAFLSSGSGRPEWTGITIPTRSDPGLAPAGEHLLILTALARFDAVKNWRFEKERAVESLVAVAEERIPGLARHLTFCEGATPRTLERYTRNEQGAVYGWALSPGQVGPGRGGQSTPVDGLFLAGHWTQPGGGVQGVIASGIQAARLALGYEDERPLWSALSDPC
jgi:phytoene desaturase